MTGAVLRPMVDADLLAVMPLEHELFGAQAWSEEALRDELQLENRWYLVAEFEGTLVAYGGIAAFGDEVHLMTIGTASAQQGRGIGRQLLRALLELADDGGAQQVILEVRVDNEPAIAMYESEGFARVGVRKGYYQPENVDAAVMIRG